LKGTVESTGASTRIFDRWLSHPTDRPRDFVKLHAVIEDREATLSIGIMDGTKYDTTLIPCLIRNLGVRVSIAKSGRWPPSGNNAQLLGDMNAITYVKPRSSSTIES